MPFEPATRTRTKPHWPLAAPLLVLACSLLTACASPPNASSTNPSPVAGQSLQTRQQIALAMWQERCKTAGEKIHRTVENVEGVFLMKLRPNEFNFDDQFRLDDPYGHDSTGERYIIDFLGGFSRPIKERDPNAPAHNGFHYVEVNDPKDGLRYRYTGRVKAIGQMDHTAPNVQIDLKRDPNFDLNIYRFALERTLAPDAIPRYAVTYDDISTREEREYWIAGSSLKVLDLQTNELIAERIGYMVDVAQGVRTGGRSPWLLAADSACPSFQRNPYRPIALGHGSAAQSGQTLDFAEKVLRPRLRQSK